VIGMVDLAAIAIAGACLACAIALLWFLERV
jgi:hypothetical protein